jgi:transposase
MRYVNEISDKNKLALEEMKRNNPSYMARTRAHAVLLSNEGIEVQELAMIFNVCRQTTAKWIKAWDKEGMNALHDKPRSGRPSNQLNSSSMVQQQRM